MKFKKEFLQEMVYGDNEETTIVLNKIVDNSRWSIIYDCVFKYQDRYFYTYYSRGATEYQEEAPYEYADDEIECTEVFISEKTIPVYVDEKGKEVCF